MTFMFAKVTLYYYYLPQCVGRPKKPPHRETSVCYQPVITSPCPETLKVYLKFHIRTHKHAHSYVYTV